MSKLAFLVFAVAMSLPSYGELSIAARRDKALKGINACERRNEASSRECKHQNQNITTLIDVYKAGDKSVLPTLFRFTYLTNFYDEALLSDTDAFLGALVKLSEDNQQAVAVGIAGGTFGLRNKERFDAIRSLLTSVPDSSPMKDISQRCLGTLERNNASFLISYFPPQTFTDRAAELRIVWYSRGLYALGEKPLWSSSADAETTYRFTHFGAFTPPKTMILRVQPDGKARINLKATTRDRDSVQLDETADITQSRLNAFLDLLNQAHFWNMPTDPPPSRTLGHDGADWMLEAVQNGAYHVVVRWCPDARRAAEEGAFADAARFLFELAGHKYAGGC